MANPSYQDELSSGGYDATASTTKPGAVAYGQFETGFSTPTASNDLTEGYSVGSFWYDPVTETFWVCVDNALGNAKWKQINMALSGPVIPLQQFLTDANGTAASTVDAYSYTVPANTLTTNGESIKAVYAGTVNSNQITSVEVMFAGTSIFWSDEISLIGDWRLDVDIVRTGATTARCSVGFIYRQNANNEYTVLSTGLDFGTGEILKLRLYAEDLGTDITARIGKIWKQGAA